MCVSIGREKGQGKGGDKKGSFTDVFAPQRTGTSQRTHLLQKAR